MTIQDEYFIIEVDFYKTSLLEFNESYYKNNRDEISSLDITYKAYIDTPIKFSIDKRQQNPVPSNFMYSDSMHYVLEEKFRDIILPLNLRNTQYFPAIIKDRAGIEHTNYFMWYIYNIIRCVDLDKSTVVDKDRDEGEYFIYKLTINGEKLKTLHIRDRMIFRLAESIDMLLVHKSLVDILRANDVSGVNFYTVREWYININAYNEVSDYISK